MPVIENIASRHKFLGMGIMKLIKKIQVSIKKYWAQEGVIAGVIAPINGGDRVISFMGIGGNPIIENA